MNKLSSILVLVFFSTLSFAGNDKGNGGDAIVCRNPLWNDIKSAELLDYYEGRELRSLKLKINSSLSLREQVMGYARKLAEYSSYALFSDIELEAFKLIHAAEEFEKGILYTTEVKFTKGTLIDIPDSSSLSIPSGCAIEQLAIRIAKNFDDDPSYLIQADIFSKLDKNQRAGLILHEVIYRAFTLKLGHTDSVTARYFHQLMMQTDAEEFSYENYELYLKKSKINYKFKKEKNSCLQ
jgi:hypothetical protein